MLEVASELVGRETWAHKQARIDLRVQGPNGWEVSLFASDGPDAVAEVLAGAVNFGIINPATAIGPALRRLRVADDRVAAIATIPSYDQLGLAVSATFGITRLEDLAEAAPPLHLSLRGQRNHSVQMVVEDVLGAVEVSFADIETWGGRVIYQNDLPHRGERATAMADGSVSAVFDEGIYNWVDLAHDAGLVFLTMGADVLDRLESMGYRRAVLRRRRFPTLATDIDTVDFSGFLIYTHADEDDDLVESFCSALHARADRIPWQGGPQLPLTEMVVDAIDAPLPVPLHPAAAAFWRSHLPAPSSGGGEAPG